MKKYEVHRAYISFYSSLRQYCGGADADVEAPVARKAI
jgi:hypothetical protein